MYRHEIKTVDRLREPASCLPLAPWTNSRNLASVIYETPVCGRRANVDVEKFIYLSLPCRKNRENWVLAPLFRRRVEVRNTDKLLKILSNLRHGLKTIYNGLIGHFSRLCHHRHRRPQYPRLRRPSTRRPIRSPAAAAAAGRSAAEVPGEFSPSLTTTSSPLRSVILENGVQYCTRMCILVSS